MSATPLLDREESLPEVKKPRRFVPALAGVILGVLVVIWGPSKTPSLSEALLLIAASYASILATLIGHMVAGVAAGFEIRVVIAAGFVLQKQAQGWRLSFDTRRILSILATMSPRSTDGLARRYAWMAAGGPIASVGVVLLLLALPAAPSQRLMLLFNLYLIARSFIPSTALGVPNPARSLWILTRKGPAADRVASVLYLFAIDAQGVRPSAWPAEVVEKIGVGAKDAPYLSAALVLQYAVARDRNDAEATAAALENALAFSGDLIPDTRRWLFTKAACFQAAIRTQTVLADAWLESARGVKGVLVREKDWDSQAVGWIALAKAESETVQESLTRYLALVDKRPRPLCGMMVAERARTEALLDQTPPPASPSGVRPLIAALVMAALIAVSSASAAQTAPTWKEFSIGPPTRNASRIGRQGITAEGIPLQRAIARAYGVAEFLVVGPAWIGDDRYAITALVDDPKDFQPLFQKELAERFHLAAHREMRDLPVYVLQPVEGASHKLASLGGGGGSLSTGAFKLSNSTVKQFTDQLADFVERPVIDETGIAGRFDISLSWGRGDAALMAAVKDQMGLQLNGSQRPVEVLVVDHVEKLEFHAAAVPAPVAQSASDPAIAGDWRGILRAEGREYRLVLHFARGADGVWLGSVDDLDEPGGMGQPYSSVSFQDSTLRLTTIRYGTVGRYEGKLDAAGNINGMWTQLGLSVPVILTRDPALQASPVKAAEFSGKWQGDLDLGLAALWLVIDINSTGPAVKATLDSPDQEGPSVRSSSARIDGSFVTVEWKDIGAVYKARMNNDHTLIEGAFTQGAVETSLVLKPVKDAAELARKRPQTPVKPYPYIEERVHFANPSARIQLGATLTIPPGKGPFPAAVLIAGSGPLGRDEDVNGHMIFLVLADYLTRHGIAVLRADKRGVGDSTGDFTGALTTDFASDVEAGLSYLRGRKEIDPSKIGLIGHSEGGLIAPIVAARERDVAFVVLMAGTGVPGDLLAAEQYQTTLEARGVAASAWEKIPQSVVSWLYSSTPWMRAFLTIDPADALRQVACPVLAIDGSKDRQVLPGPNLQGIRAALQAGGNRHFEIDELPGLNHLFQTADTGWPREYGHIEETIAPSVLDKILNWIEGALSMR